MVGMIMHSGEFYQGNRWKHFNYDFSWIDYRLMMKNYECDTGDEHHEKCEMSRYQLSKRWMIEDIYNTAIDNDVRYDWVKVLCLICRRQKCDLNNLPHVWISSIDDPMKYYFVDYGEIFKWVMLWMLVYVVSCTNSIN